MRYLKYGFPLLALMSLAACQRAGSEAAAAATPAPSASAAAGSTAASGSSASPFLVKASIREIMDAEIDPAADALWESVAVINGEQKQPHTPEEWQAVRRNAITLIEATNLIVMDGRRIAPAGAHYTDEADPELLQKRLEANRAPFIGMAEALRGVSVKMLDAIDAKDADRLFDLGSDLDEACEACHLAYYYPRDLEPKR